jgi:hypothetical protein
VLEELTSALSSLSALELNIPLLSKTEAHRKLAAIHNPQHEIGSLLNCMADGWV